jgi:MYXO-CTERM domain-containing protein
MKRLGIAAVLGAAMLCAPSAARAFCGFYVAGGDQQMFNDATQVVLMRKGTRTVLAMQNNYKGPPEAFAMVVPVPTVLKEADVKTLPKEVFANVERMGAPRLVEYWERDPCAPEVETKELALRPAPRAAMPREAAAVDKDFGVTIEAQFVVGEYQIVILSAKDSTGLDGWLRAEKYNIPAGAEPLLRPYVENGMKFFVAKVDPTKVKFEDGRAALSPLRFHYDSEQFNLPIRLGLANSSGKQDLIVNILAPGQRYEVANYGNVTIPTNIDVKESVKDKFGAFYTALFDATIEKHPGAVVTEYAWQATTCDPCPGPALNYQDFITLGSDVLDTPAGQAAPAAPAPTKAAGAPDPGAMRRPMPMPRRPWMNNDFVLTRLHARYGKDITNDLEFKAAPPIVGGREFVVDAKTGKLEEGARPDSINNFQGRYAIRHEWTGPITCNNPTRHRWGGPPAEVMNKPGFQATGIKPALDLAFAPRGEVQLPAVVEQDVPELGIKAAAVIATPNPPGPATAPSTPPADSTKKKTGCGCHATNDASGGLLLLALLGLRRRMR